GCAWRLAIAQTPRPHDLACTRVDGEERVGVGTDMKPSAIVGEGCGPNDPPELEIERDVASGIAVDHDADESPGMGADVSQRRAVGAGVQRRAGEDHRTEVDVPHHLGRRGRADALRGIESGGTSARPSLRLMRGSWTAPRHGGPTRNVRAPPPGTDASVLAVAI